jgi:hypothetical protein
MKTLLSMVAVLALVTACGDEPQSQAREDREPISVVPENPIKAPQAQQKAGTKDADQTVASKDSAGTTKGSLGQAILEGEGVAP